MLSSFGTWAIIYTRFGIVSRMGTGYCGERPCIPGLSSEDPSLDTAGVGSFESLFASCDCDCIFNSLIQLLGPSVRLIYAPHDRSAPASLAWEWVKQWPQCNGRKFQPA